MVTQQSMEGTSLTRHNIRTSLYVLSAASTLAGYLSANHYLPWTSFYNEFPIVIALLLLATAATLGARGDQNDCRIPTGSLFFIVLSLIPIVQFSFGKIYFIGDAIVPSLYLAASSLACMVAIRFDFKQSSHFPLWIAAVVLLSAVISTFIAVHQWLELDQLGIWILDMPSGGRPYGNLGQPNNLATLLCCGIVSALYLNERRKFSDTILWLLVALMLAGVAMTRSRTAFLVVLVIAGWVLWGRRKLSLKCSAAQVAAGLSLFTLLWVGWGAVSEWLYISSELTVSRIEAAIQTEVRPLLWRQLFDAALQGPFTGYGWNQVSVAQIAVAAEYPQSLLVEHSHNFILDLIIYNGIFIGSIVVAVIAWWLKSRILSLTSIDAWFGLAIVLVVLTHGMLEYPLNYTYFLLLVACCIGIVDHERPPPRGLRVGRGAFAAVVMFGWIMLSWLFVEYQHIEADHRRMRFEAVGIELNGKIETSPSVVLLSQLRDFLRLARTEAREGMSEDEIEWMRKVAHRYPYPAPLFRYAVALGLNNQSQAAALELSRFKKLHSSTRFEEFRAYWNAYALHHPQLLDVVLAPSISNTGK